MHPSTSKGTALVRHLMLGKTGSPTHNRPEVSGYFKFEACVSCGSQKVSIVRFYVSCPVWIVLQLSLCQTLSFHFTLCWLCN